MRPGIDLMRLRAAPRHESSIGARIVVLVGAVALAAGCASAPPRPVDPLSAEEHNDLGVAYYRDGDYPSAAREFRRALDRRPDFTRARVNLGDAELAQGAIDAAIAAYEAARTASPDDPAIANNLAWALLQHRQRWPEAEALVRGALARDPEPRGYYLDTLGLALLKRGAAREALDAFRAALDDTKLRDVPARTLVLRHAGDALAQLGDASAAERCYRLAGDSGGSDARPTTTSAVAAAHPDAGPDVRKVGGRDTVC